MSSNNDAEFLQALQAYGYEGGSAAVAGAGRAGMETDGMDDRTFFEALAMFGGPQLALAGAGAVGAGAAGADVAAAPSLGQLCQTWQSARAIVQRVAPFLGAIPGIGTALAAALTTLGGILDGLCRGSGTAAQLCERWRGGLRTILLRAADLVERIPLIGGAASRGLRALIVSIDAVCRAA